MERILTENPCQVPTAPESCAANRSLDQDRFTLFPIALFEETIEILKQRGVRFLRYRDLNVRINTAMLRLSYLSEYATFMLGKENAIAQSLSMACIIVRRLMMDRLARIISKTLPTRSGSYVIIQHDADRQPHKSVEMMRLERKHGLVSSSYFFRRRHLVDEDDEAYFIDIKALQDLERDGFEIGYHLNAYELANFDAQIARAIARDDIRWFRKYFDVRSFAPHGGSRGPSGITNSAMPLPQELKRLVCAYNCSGGNVLVDFDWSDGGLSQKAPQDPREFAKQLPSNGVRARMLMHPQYYGNRLGDVRWEEKPLAKTIWWRNLWGLQ